MADVASAVEEDSSPAGSSPVLVASVVAPPEAAEAVVPSEETPAPSGAIPSTLERASALWPLSSGAESDGVSLGESLYALLAQLEAGGANFLYARGPSRAERVELLAQLSEASAQWRAGRTFASDNTATELGAL